MNRRTQPHGEGASPVDPRPAPAGVAAGATARVAIRFSSAPSYEKTIVRETRTAVQAVQTDSKTAQVAPAAFQYALGGLKAAAPAKLTMELEAQPSHVSERQAVPVVRPARKTPNLPRAYQEPAIHEPAKVPVRESKTGIRHPKPGLLDAPRRYASPAITEVQTVEPVLPIYANLIQFPREIVATRKARPRRAEGPLAAAGSAPQLSIFEVDTAAISTLPPPTAVDPSAPPAWMRPEWPALTLEALPPSPNLDALLPSPNLDAALPSTNLDAQAPVKLAEDTSFQEPAPQIGAPAAMIEPAPLNLRLLASVVDCALVAAAFLTAAMLAAHHAGKLPGVRTVEYGAAFALLAIGVAYHACCLILAGATPGMRYAGIKLSTFSGLKATQTQRWRRLMALLLSLLPLGLGFVWALFDDGHLAWHDRLSKTYLRKR